MRIKVADTVYPLDALEQVTLKDILSFDGQAADMRLGYTWEDITGTLAEKAEEDMTEREQLVMFGVTVWAAQRIAGERVTLDEALDRPLSDFQVLPDPQDRQEGSRPPTKGQGPRKKTTKKKPGSKAASRGSAAAAAERPDPIHIEGAPQG